MGTPTMVSYGNPALKSFAPSVEVNVNVNVLSAREKQVLALAAAGFLDKQIGEQLGISLNTLRTYWSRIRDKAGGAPRTALAVAFIAAENKQQAEGQFTLEHEGWIFDAETGMAMASDAINSMHGLEFGVPHPRAAYAKIFHPEDREKAIRAMDEVLEGRSETNHFKLRLVTKEGIKTHFLTLHGVKNESGQVVKVIAYRAKVLEGSPEANSAVRVGLLIRDIDANTFSVDRPGCDLLHIPYEQAHSRAAFIGRIHPEDRDEVERFAVESIKAGMTEGQKDFRLLFDDGTVTWARAQGRADRDSSGHMIVYSTVYTFDKSLESAEEIGSYVNSKLLGELQKQVLGLAAGGFSDNQIEDALNLSEVELWQCWQDIRANLGDAPRETLASAFIFSEIDSKLPRGPDDRLLHEGYVLDLGSDMIIASDTANDEHGLARGVPHHRDSYLRTYHADDVAAIKQATFDISRGRVQHTHLAVRVMLGQEYSISHIVVRSIRDQSGKVIKIMGYRTRNLTSRLDAQHLRMGFWAKNLRTDKFITPDEQFCKIYDVDRNSPTLDRDIRSRYDPAHRRAAYDFINEAVEEGLTRGSRDFRLVFEDGTDLWIRLEYFIESDDQGPVRINGTVVAFH